MSEHFMSGKPQIATKTHLELNWRGGKKGERFRCYLCGYKFKEGDYWRFQFTNDVHGAAGNPLVCQNCDGTKEEIIKKWKKMHEEVETKYWWFR